MLVDFSARTRLEILGDDRASFLHNLCTNNIKGLAPGAGCEAFLCDARGHVLGHAYIFNLPGRLLLETVPEQEAPLLAHFDKYHIREKISLRGLTASTAAWLVAGSDAANVLSPLLSHPLPTSPLAAQETTLAGLPAIIARTTLVRGDNWLVATDVATRDRVAAALREAGAQAVAWSAFEMARLERGVPFFGIDISDKNLPQEVGRDPLAISFTKGCYLGQETVARIDALGHVNRRLASLHFSGEEAPAAGAMVMSEDTEIGRITSAAAKPGEGKVFALAYLKRGHDAPGTVVQCGANRGIVVEPAAT